MKRNLTQHPQTTRPFILEGGSLQVPGAMQVFSLVSMGVGVRMGIALATIRICQGGCEHVDSGVWEARV